MNVRTTTATALFAALIAVAQFATSTATSTLPRVHPGVHRALRKQGSVNLIVTLAATTESTLESVKEAAFESRTTQIESLKEKLEAHNKVASAEVVKLLSQERSGAAPLHAGYKSFWISNQLLVAAASFELVEKLARLASIKSIREEAVAKLDKPADFGLVESRVAKARRLGVQQYAGYEWGIGKIGAPQVWAAGNTGQGVVVGCIDSGVRWTHEAVKGSFRGAYGWYDPELHSAEPYDVDGHGTHTVGTIAGSRGIGVAPGAKWMACKGCRVDDCTDSDLLECAQFMLCPTDTAGKNADCSKAPRVVSNSWSSPGGDDWYQAAVDAWVAAGIVPVFSQGNTGPDCNTVRSPGDYSNVIAVGASTPSDELAPYSARGPSCWGHTKPDISAPGYAVRSSYGTSDTDYVESYGTSMATPHVAGAIALMLSAEPRYTVSEVKRVLSRTSTKKGLKASNSTCGNTTDAKWPNNQWGGGRLDAFDAYINLDPLPSIRH